LQNFEKIILIFRTWKDNAEKSLLEIFNEFSVKKLQKDHFKREISNTVILSFQGIPS
jgi:hypothetical protein